MKDQNDNRVLGRRGARILNETETKVVSGVGTATLCSFNPKTGPDGDTFAGECA